MRKLIALLACLLVAAPAFAQGDARRIESPGVRVGDTWMFNNIDGWKGSLEEVSVNVVKRSDSSGIVMESSSLDGSSVAKILRTTAFNLVRVEAPAFTQKAEPFYPNYSFPLFVGKTWSGKVVLSNTRRPGTEVTATLRANHLQTWAAFALGYEQDTAESILETCEWGISNHFTFAAFNVLMPYPSTPFYKRLQAEGRLLYDGRWWLHPDYRFNHAAFRPKQMTADELTEAAWACRRRWSSRASILKRALDLRTNLATPFRFATYVVYNPLFRREAFKRQGMRLGTR